MRPPKKEDALFLTKQEWLKVFLAMSSIIIVLYIVAMMVSLSGNTYFILNYENAHMDAIESWFRSHGILCLISLAFSTLEFFIISFYINRKSPKWYFVLAFYLPVAITAIFVEIPQAVFYLVPFLFHLIMPLFEKGMNGKTYSRRLLRLLVAIACVVVLQIMIYVIKSGGFTTEVVKLSLAANFCYALEYDIALSVLLITVVLFIDREKGDSLWAKHLGAGSSSQILKTQSQKSNTVKKLTKTQRNKIRWFYAKMYLTQLGAFILILVLPFAIGKVLEFLVMYLSFAIARYILGFKYSLHFKKEALCISVGLLVFGILSLAVPFFYVVLVMAVNMGIGLAVLLHLSYKYKSMWLFQQVSKPDKFALLYVFFDGDLSERHIMIICQRKGLDHFQTLLIYNYMKAEKLSVIAHKFHYSQRMLIYKLDEAIDKLLA